MPVLSNFTTWPSDDPCSARIPSQNDRRSCRTDANCDLIIGTYTEVRSHHRQAPLRRFGVLGQQQAEAVSVRRLIRYRQPSIAFEDKVMEALNLVSKGKYSDW
ncbi:hypothetical protein N7G274_008179 [Stereocaulon virgatum]|uniref:Uncharacterized protein n=1 Tax=Stereocaulon virgatum TaxID=373712 RepID=A0ABR4A123_9LECA